MYLRREKEVYTYVPLSGEPVRVLGVAPAPSYTFLIYVSPVGPYFKSGVKCLNLRITNQFHRAAPKGTGGHKVIGNYAASLFPQRMVKKAGFDEAIYSERRE